MAAHTLRGAAGCGEGEGLGLLTLGNQYVHRSVTESRRRSRRRDIVGIPAVRDRKAGSVLRDIARSVGVQDGDFEEGKLVLQGRGGRQLSLRGYLALEDGQVQVATNGGKCAVLGVQGAIIHQDFAIDHIRRIDIVHVTIWLGIDDRNREVGPPAFFADVVRLKGLGYDLHKVAAARLDIEDSYLVAGNERLYAGGGDRLGGGSVSGKTDIDLLPGRPIVFRLRFQRIIQAVAADNQCAHDYERRKEKKSTKVHSLPAHNSLILRWRR